MEYERCGEPLREDQRDNLMYQCGFPKDHAGPHTWEGDPTFAVRKFTPILDELISAIEDLTAAIRKDPRR